jgi:large subunit ribosomal protein L14
MSPLVYYDYKIQILLNFFYKSASGSAKHIQFMSRVRIVDDSQLGQEGMAYKRAPRIIHVYNKKRIGNIGDRVLLAIKGQKQKAIVVGLKNHYRKDRLPNFDTNNCVLVDDQDTPLGTRITAPIPASLRSHPSCNKLIAIATRFV